MKYSVNLGEVPLGYKKSEGGVDTQGVASRKQKPLHIVRRKRAYRGRTSYLTKRREVSGKSGTRYVGIQRN